MATFYLLPSAVDYVRVVNDNTIDNLLAAQPSYTSLPTLYQRAYTVVHQTGAVRVQKGFAAPNTPVPTPKVFVTVDPRVF